MVYLIFCLLNNSLTQFTFVNVASGIKGLNAFYDVFLRHGGIGDILPEISLLFGFFIVTTLVAIVYNEKKNAV